MMHGMWRALTALLVSSPFALHAQPVPVVRPTAGMVITRSVRVAPGTYRLRASPHADSALATVRGSNITVDMRGVTFIGMPTDSSPDAAVGTAIRIESGANVTVRGLTARGYRWGVVANGVRNLILEHNNFSHSWKLRLFSLVEHESLVDWLSFHKNEADEWRRFGAGMHLRDIHGGAIRNNVVRQSMNGLLLSHSDSLDIRSNDFSYNSGLGIGLYRASWHTVVDNRLDYNVRGSSLGFFQRGQDSAALLMFEQCNNNVVAYNSMTHSGDGLFLWAGQHTMDTGQGGSNDNLFLMNDVSYAPTNGLEATFSRNQFIGNRVVGSTHGLWGGYSFDSRVVGNCFADNRIAIAIEHGQNNLVGGNRFQGDTLAIRLWADSIAPSDWGYPKHRDTRSRDWRIVENSFSRVPERWRLANTVVVDSGRNTVSDSAMACDPARIVPTTAWWRVPTIANAPTRWPDAPNAARDRSAIVVDEWGPYDWQAPKLWPLDSVRSRRVRLRVLGPPGQWSVARLRGVAALSSSAGRTGDTIVVTPHSDSASRWQLELTYRGAATVSARGVRSAAGVPVRFAYGIAEPPQSWQARVTTFSDSTSPLTSDSHLQRVIAQQPVWSKTLPRLDWMWSRPREPGIPASNFLMLAEGEVTLDSVHTLRTISDDAVRVWVNDSLLVDHWAPHESAPAYAVVPRGRHRVRVAYVQRGGWVELRLDWLRGRVRPSPGSAGPH
ncbi:MAG: right-handed parallel beta-helix repeat-containing protein [Gemmatimonadaceae bacterium]|nr:right-handed parallel beta-helix repeat-containing protein [Gemmatimonadaceae bacterium]